MQQFLLKHRSCHQIPISPSSLFGNFPHSWVRTINSEQSTHSGISGSYWALWKTGSVHVRGVGGREGGGWGVCVWVTTSLREWDKYGILQQLPWLTTRWHNPTQHEALRPQTPSTSWWEHSSWKRGETKVGQWNGLDSDDDEKRVGGDGVGGLLS